MTSQSGSAKEDANDPQSVLENHGCSVFLPDVVKNKLDWDYLAGYQSVKR
jgi:SpoVK/Ycf46/Vps4 family AAA+-type ATPase